MNTVTVIVETEQSPDLAADPLWRSERTAAMIPLSWMADAAGYATPAWLGPQLPRVAELLRAMPVHLRWLNMGGWYGNYEFASPSYGGVTTPQPHNPNPDRLTAGTAYVARRLRELGVDALAGVYVDNEGTAIKADGTAERYEQANRMAFLRRCLTPLAEGYDCPIVNFACANPPNPAKTLGWWGGPFKRGTIDGTQSVDTYSGRGEPNSEWAVKRRNVRECVKAGPVITHGPALYRWQDRVYSTPEEAAQDTYDGIIADTAVGVRTHFIAAYEWKEHEHWPLLAATIKRAAASAARLVEDGR